VTLVTLGLVNAEVGAIQEVAAIARATSRAGALFHLDAAQALAVFLCASKTRMRFDDD